MAENAPSPASPSTLAAAAARDQPPLSPHPVQSPSNSSSEPASIVPPQGHVAAEVLERLPIEGVPMLDFARQHREIGAEVLAAVEGVLSSQRFILGPQVAEFEAAAAAHCRAGYGIGCASGTDALWLALAAAHIGEGDAVVTTPFSFFATASSVLRAGARPVFADIDPATFNLSAAAVRSVLTRRRDSLRSENRGAAPREFWGESKIRAVLPVHLYGQPVAWNEFADIKQEFGIFLLEDAAQAFGARWDDRPVGSLGDAAAFSFYPTKNLSAAGDAGLITTNDAVLAEHAAMLRSHGMRHRYYHDEVGWNSRLDTLQAAILLVKLAYLDRWNQARGLLAANYQKLFTEYGIAESNTPYPTHGVVVPQAQPRATHVWHQYVIRVARRDGLKQFLGDRKIGCETYYPLPLHLQKSLKHLGYREGDFPESERAAREVLALPIYPELRADEQETVVAAIARFLS